MKDKDFDEYYDDKDEWLYEWKSDNKEKLMEDFVEEMPDEWNEFLEMKRATLEQDDLDYWRLLFCEEEMPDEFNKFCEDEFNNHRDIVETDNAIWNERYSMKGGGY